MVAMVGNAEHALHRAHGAADTRPNGAADHPTHGTGDAIALMGAFLGATHDALGVAGLRQRDEGEQETGRRKKAGGKVNRPATRRR